LGFPLGGGLQVTSGIVTGRDPNRIDTTAVVTYGSSGSGVYNAAGRLAGIVKGELRAGGDKTGFSVLVPISRAAGLLGQVEHEDGLPCSGVKAPPPSDVSPPAEIVSSYTVEVDDEDRTAYSGGPVEPNPGCQNHDTESCVSPQHGGQFIPDTAHFVVRSLTDATLNRTNATLTVNSPFRVCYALHAQTGACELRYEISGHASAIEKYER